MPVLKGSLAVKNAISTRLSDQDLRRLEIAAKEENISRTHLIREALLNYLISKSQKSAA
jgi:predicted transcriptional regulator